MADDSVVPVVEEEPQAVEEEPEVVMEEPPVVVDPEIYPPTFSSMKPQLFVEAPLASDAVHFFKEAFSAEEVHRVVQHKRKAHQDQSILLSVELKIGGFSFLVSDTTDDSHPLVRDGAGRRYVICLETNAVDAVAARAVFAGALKMGGVAASEGTSRAAEDKVILQDPFGNVWVLTANDGLTLSDLSSRWAVSSDDAQSSRSRIVD